MAILLPLLSFAERGRCLDDQWQKKIRLHRIDNPPSASFLGLFLRLGCQHDIAAPYFSVKYCNYLDKVLLFVTSSRSCNAPFFAVYLGFMNVPILKIISLSALLGMLLLVVTPVICELNYCCCEEEVVCTIECDDMCCVVALCTEAFDGLFALDATFHEPFVLTSSLPEGVLPLPERPPIAAC